MKSIIKTFILSNNEKKWSEYRNRYHTFFKDRDKFFDTTLNFIQDFYSQFSEFPNFETFQKELISSGEEDFLKYATSVVQDPQAQNFQKNLDFLTHLSSSERKYFELDVIKAVKESQNNIATLKSKKVESIVDEVNKLVSEVYKVKNKVLKDEASDTVLLYGEKGLNRGKEIYAEIEKKKNSKDDLFYTLGFEKFDKHIRMKPGELVFFGGAASHGKSVFLRHMARRLVTKYGLNVVFITLEMPLKDVQSLFDLSHANDKKIFPGTPKILRDKYKEGNLTREEKHFLFDVAARDLNENESYGTLLIEQPKKLRYTLSDLDMRITEIENNIMPVHAIAVDYMSLMYPLEGNIRRKVDMDDYNLMIKGFKNMALTHKNRKGEIKPFLGLSVAQISRHAFRQCVKDDGVYDISCMSMYTEIERSCDIVMSTLMLDDLRRVGKLKSQNLKNRDGALVIDPVEMFISLDSGLNLSDGAEEVDQNDQSKALQEILF